MAGGRPDAPRLRQFKLTDDPGEGRTLIERARATFEQIGATGWVKEAEAALLDR